MENQTQDQQQDNFRLSDTAIAGMMQLLQAAIMTGTDMLDLMRMLQFEVNDASELQITEASVKGVEEFCQDLLQRAEEAAMDKVQQFGAVVDHAEG